jgi:hypothetical protein
MNMSLAQLAQAGWFLVESSHFMDMARADAQNIGLHIDAARESDALITNTENRNGPQEDSR